MNRGDIETFSSYSKMTKMSQVFLLINCDLCQIQKDANEFNTELPSFCSRLWYKEIPIQYKSHPGY